MKRAIWLLIVVALAACGPRPAANEPTPQVTTSPSPSVTASPAQSPAVPSPSSSLAPTPTPVAQCWPYRGGSSFKDTTNRPSIVDVRVGAHPGYDRLVIQFTNLGLPNYELMPNQIPPGGGTTFREDPSDRSVTVQGGYGVRLQIFYTDWMHDSFASGRDLVPGYPVLKEVRVVGDYEAIATIAIGLKADICPTVSELSSPPRLVIDFPT